MTGKINVKTIGGLFLVIMLLLIFFSKTIYTYGLPTVTATRPQGGKLNKYETATGIVDWENTRDIYAEVGGRVEELLVREGDFVAQGQPLIRLSFDEDEARAKLKELAISKSKLAVDIETIHKKLDKTNRYIADLTAETYERDTVSGYELAQLESRIAQKEEETENLEFLLGAGVATRSEYDSAAAELQSLRAERDNLIKTMAENEEKADEDIETKEKNRRKQLADYQYEIEALQQELKAKNLDLSNLAISEENYERTLSDYNRNTEITAPEYMTVISAPLKNGQRVNEDQLMLSFGIGSDFIVECEVSLENNFVTAGDACVLSNASHELEGVVQKVTPAEHAKKVTVAVSAEELAAGETFELRFEKESAAEYTLVPNGAVNRDSDGYYVYRIKRRDGILGKEFYAEKVSVYIGDSDNEYTAITKGIMFFEPLALYSDKPFAEGDTILLKNEGDFFAD